MPMDTENIILRCDGCQRLVHTLQLSKLGCCYHCGNRRYKSVQTLQEEENQQLKDKTYRFGLSEWPDGIEEFRNLFEAVEDL